MPESCHLPPPHARALIAHEHSTRAVTLPTVTHRTSARRPEKREYATDVREGAHRTRTVVDSGVDSPHWNVWCVPSGHDWCVLSDRRVILVLVRAAPVVSQRLSEGLLAARTQHTPRSRWLHATLSAYPAFHRHTPSPEPHLQPARGRSAGRPHANAPPSTFVRFARQLGRSDTLRVHASAPIGTSTLRQSRRATVRHATRDAQCPRGVGRQRYRGGAEASGDHGMRDGYADERERGAGGQCCGLLLVDADPPRRPRSLCPASVPTLTATAARRPAAAQGRRRRDD
jgi:hypothetical protein